MCQCNGYIISQVIDKPIFSLSYNLPFTLWKLELPPGQADKQIKKYSVSLRIEQ